MGATMLSLLRNGAAASVSGEALIERRGSAYKVISHESLEGAIAAAAGALARLGVRPGDVVGLWLPNGLDYLALQFAAAGLGAAVLGVNTRYGSFELAHIVAVARPKVMALPARFLDLDFPARLAAAVGQAEQAAGAAARMMVVVCGDVVDDDLGRFDVGGGAERLDLGALSPALVDGGWPEAPASYFTTSGSTGAPKLAGHDQASVAIHSPLVAHHFGIGPEDVVLGVLPFCGVFGFNVVLAALAAGASVLIDPVFDAATVLSAMGRFGVTHAFGGDDVWGRLREAWRADPIPLARLRRGAIAQFEGRTETLGAWARDSLGAELTGVYGSSELMAFTMGRPPNQPDIALQVRGGGRPISDRIELRIADPETGEVLSEGQGELQARGYPRLTHYLGAPEATARAITPDGWYRSGDLVSRDADGGYTFICRNTEALRLRGFLVEPAEIEQCLMSHPAVGGARVVGARGDHGDTPVAFVTLEDQAVTGEALIAFCKGRLAAFKVPTRVVFLDAFPVTAGTNGAKVKLEELRRMAAALLPAAESADRSSSASPSDRDSL
jgi:fatty-acyl-CoA synthase